VTWTQVLANNEVQRHKTSPESNLGVAYVTLRLGRAGDECLPQIERVVPGLELDPIQGRPHFTPNTGFKAVEQPAKLLET
jgi:hypothetical protein